MAAILNPANARDSEVLFLRKCNCSSQGFKKMIVNQKLALFFGVNMRLALSVVVSD
jgi:hypothetical protein